MKALLLLAITLFVSAFRHVPINVNKYKSKALNMIELEANTATYVGMFVATMLPSLAFVKFIGDQADKSRSNISDEVSHPQTNYFGCFVSLNLTLFFMIFSKRRNLRKL